MHTDKYKKNTKMNNIKNYTPPFIHALYAPGIERFFAIIGLDQFTSMEIAQILSSKIPSIVVFSVNENTPPFFLDNCHEYTLIDKNVYKNSYEIQTPRFKNMSVNDVIKADELPIDFHPKHNADNYKLFMNLKKYVEFVTNTWNAAKIAELTHNLLPEKCYADDYFQGYLPDDFVVNPDTSIGVTPNGITSEIKKILYDCNSPEEALAEFDKMWKENNTVQTMAWRNSFYTISYINPNIKPLSPNMDKFIGWLM